MDRAAGVQTYPAAERRDALIESVEAFAYTIPTDRTESDGTYEWNSTTLVVATVGGGGQRGVGYTYSDRSVTTIIDGLLANAVAGHDALSPQIAWQSMARRVRNIGRDGIAANAIAAVDCAIWDLKAKLLGVSLATLFGCARDEVEIYGSGGFTSYSDTELCEQLAGWVNREGCRSVKMKIGSRPDCDPERVRKAKRAIGPAALFVDANGAYSVKRALALADVFWQSAQVAWFEEPVSSDDLVGLAELKRRAPSGMDVAAGEYGYDLDYFLRMLADQAVDVQQADVTRCGGYTVFLQVAALCEAFHLDLSAHCAPALHLPVACAAPRFRNIEWFHDHVRIERMLFDGCPIPAGGMIRPDRSRPGHGLEFKFKDAEGYRVA